MNRFLRSLTLARLLTLVAFIAVFAMAFRTPLDTDTLWHLRAGQWQVEHRALLRTDLFSHTRAGEPWVNHSWGAQLLLYGAYAALGDPGLALYTALLAVLGMAFVWPQLRGNAAVRAFTLVLAAASAAVFWSARPQMISFALSAVVLCLLWRWREEGVDRLWFIPPLVALWANLHGGFAIAFILIVLTLIGDVARWLFEDVIGGSRPAGERALDGLRPALRLVVVGLVAAAAVSLNPYGPKMLLYPFRTVGIGVLQDFIQEWASPNFHGAETWPFIWLLLGTLAVVGFSGRKLDWRDAALVGGTAYSALLAGRNIATFAIVAAPVFALHLGAWLDALGVRLRLERRPRGVFLAANWLIALLVVGAGLGKAALAVDPATIEEARQAGLPVAAAEALEEIDPPGALFNSYNWGGYLIWQARDFPVYVDGRTDLYDDELLRVYLNTYFAQDGWAENLAGAGINTVLVERGSPLAVALGLTDGWALAYEDDIARLYVREVPLGD